MPFDKKEDPDHCISAIVLKVGYWEVKLHSKISSGLSSWMSIISILGKVIRFGLRIIVQAVNIFWWGFFLKAWKFAYWLYLTPSFRIWPDPEWKIMSWPCFDMTWHDMTWFGQIGCTYWFFLAINPSKLIWYGIIMKGNYNWDVPVLWHASVWHDMTWHERTLS